MTVKEIVNKVSKAYQMSEDELLKTSTREKSEVETDILQLLSSYHVKNLKELEYLIAEKTEHSRLSGRECDCIRKFAVPVNGHSA